MRPFEKLVSLVLVAVIWSGLAYAHNREVVRDTNLGQVFQEINREYFPGELSGVTVEWADLDQELGRVQKIRDGEFLILVDQHENTSSAEVRETLQHEACHVFVDWQEPEEHGPMFQDCMARFAHSAPGRTLIY
jgi:hypothetical protein